MAVSFERNEVVRDWNKKCELGKGGGGGGERKGNWWLPTKEREMSPQGQKKVYMDDQVHIQTDWQIDRQTLLENPYNLFLTFTSSLFFLSSLSHLSIPVVFCSHRFSSLPFSSACLLSFSTLVGTGGIEPPTTWLYHPVGPPLSSLSFSFLLCPITFSSCTFL